MTQRKYKIVSPRVAHVLMARGFKKVSETSDFWLFSAPVNWTRKRADEAIKRVMRNPVLGRPNHDNDPLAVAAKLLNKIDRR